MAGRPNGIPIHRTSVLAYRLAAHDLGAAVDGWPGVLATGIQDTPAGSTAPLAVRARSTVADDPYRDPDLALVHGVRGTTHLHRVADLPLLAAALRPDHAADLLVSTHGPFFVELAARGWPVGDVFDHVVAAMRQVMADGAERAKGELSGAVTPLLPEALAPWCAGCAAHHPHDGLFRMATLQAGLRLRPTGDGSARFLPAPPPARAEVAPSRDGLVERGSLVRRYLRYCGPTAPDGLASWCGLSPATTRRWWKPVAGELAEVDVDGRRLWCHRDDLPIIDSATGAPGVLLLPPYDPWLEVADRTLLVADPARRRQVWRPAANPGVLLLRGEVAGVWRHRRKNRQVMVTVTAFAELPESIRRAVRATAEALFAPADVRVAAGS